VTRAYLATLGLFAVLFAGAPVRADVSKADCVKANASAQQLRIDGKLASARDKLTLCADMTCPAMVRDDCTQRLDELERVQPTLVFQVKDPSGSDVSAVRVTVDGQLVTERLVGKALRVDPGEHVFTFAVDGLPPVSRTFVVNEAEKDRRERIQLGGAPAAAGASPALVPTPGTSGAPSDAGTGGIGTRRLLAFSAGGLGVAGVAVGTVFGILSTSAASRQSNDCASATSCMNHARALSDHSTAATDGTISTALLIAGGALLAGGVTLFFTGRSASEPPPTGLVVTPSAGPGTATVSLSWRL
jgi:hypothetical protein